MICLSCGAMMSIYFTKKSFVIERCSGCNLMAVANVPDDLSSFYTEGYFTGDVSLDGYMDYDQEKAVSRKIYTRYLRVIEEYLNQSSRFLFELGCATGFFMDIARMRGWRVKGVDISSYAVTRAVSRGLDVSVGTLESINPEPIYGAVVMQDVIEHVKDPIDIVQRAFKMLTPGGLLVLTTPDADSLWAKAWGKHWHAFVPPQHLFYFSEANLSRLIEAQGFSIVHTAHHGKWFTIPYIMRLLFSWTGLKLFSTLANGTSRINFFQKTAIPINVRDTLFLIARKPII